MTLVSQGARAVRRLFHRDRSARLWREYRRRPDTHPQVPNVSYAGYHRGERPLPNSTPEGQEESSPVFDVRAYGATADGHTDDTAAFNSAIEAAGAAGGGTVRIPAGDYALDGVVWVQHSRVLLSGEGQENTRLHFRRPLEHCYRTSRSGEWSWAGGLIWFLPQAVRHGLEEQDWAWGSNEGWRGNAILSAAAAAPRGASRVRVENPGDFSVGDHVLLVVDNIADHSLLRHLCGDLPESSYDWQTGASSLHRQPNYSALRWPVQIAQTGAETVTLAQPLRFDLRPEWNPRFLTLGPRIEESGLEDVTLHMPVVDPQPHNQDLGYNGPHFQAALNCWARRVTVENSDNAFGLTSTKGVTLQETTVRGRAHHHSYICREQSHDNLVRTFAIESPTTKLPKGSLTHGLNVEGYSSGNAWADGEMVGTFDSHRRIPFDNVRTDIRITNRGVVGGAKKAGPHWGARFCHWNIEVRNNRSYALRLEEHAPYSAMVGIRGTDKISQQEPEFRGILHSATEALDSQVLPRNLYEAQLRLRLRS
ncbi:hypothetical protein GCM10009618_07090 [Nesterenkonia lacusekhoensis]|nr:glycoside hydrolase family 55 protein [Nesterenkonia lacusekhoensis]